MKTMETYANEYQTKHRKEGVVSDVTSYCFTFTPFPKKLNEMFYERPKPYVVMKSYFFET